MASITTSKRTPSRGTPSRARTPRGTPSRARTPRSPYLQQQPKPKKRNTRRSPSGKKRRTPKRMTKSNTQALRVYGKQFRWAPDSQLKKVKVVSGRKGRKSPFRKTYTPGFSTTPGSRANMQRKVKRKEAMAKKAAREEASRKRTESYSSSIKGKTLRFGGKNTRRRKRRYRRKSTRRR
jgi:hypothetical protein